MSALTQSAAWQALHSHYQSMRAVHMRDLFASDPQRFVDFSVSFNDLLLDYSKNIITKETMGLLLDFGAAGTPGRMDRQDVQR